MSEGPIRIRIGASVDASVERAFSGIEKRAQKAQVAVQRGQRQAASSAEKEAARQAKAQEKAAKEIERAAQRLAKAQEREHQRLVKAAEALDRQRSRALLANYRAEERAAAAKEARIRRELERTARDAERAQERQRRAAERSSRRQGEAFARRTSHRTSRFLTPEAPLASMAARGLRDVAGGLGVDLSVGGAFSRVTALEAHATKISNAGFLPNDVGSPNATRADPRDLVRQARDVGGQFGLDAGAALEALDAFATRAGDLDTGRRMLADMAKLSAATGTELGHMAQASAAVYQSLGDIPNKSQAVMDVMRTIAGQGKLGAVEIADMAVQMSRVAAASMKFSGDRSENIKTLGGLAQYARARGGAPSAAEAARSIGGFANTLQKSARIKEFDAAGVNIFSDKSKTKLRDPVEIIVDSLQATGGNLQKMNKLFMDVVGARTVAGLSDDFLKAGGGESGANEIRRIMARMKAAAPSDDELNESARRASETNAAKAARFQNQLDLIAEKTATQLVPALESAGPALLKFAEVLGKVSTWALENPKSAIALAITASIARAGIESTLRSGIERLITGKEGSGRAAKVGKIASTVGALGTIATLSVATVEVGKMIIDHFLDKQDQELTKDVERGFGATNEASRAGALARSDDPEALKKARAAAEAAIKGEQANIKSTKERDTVGRDIADWLLLPMNEREDIQRARENRERESITRSQQEIARLQGILESIDRKLGGELQVNATNMPSAPPSGRASQ